MILWASYRNGSRTLLLFGEGASFLKNLKEREGTDKCQKDTVDAHRV